MPADAVRAQLKGCGSSKEPAQPFLRPAYEAMKQAAADAVSQVIDQKVRQLMNGS